MHKVLCIWNLIRIFVHDLRQTPARGDFGRSVDELECNRRKVSFFEM